MKIFGTRLVTVAGLVGAAGLFLNVNCGSSSNGTGTAGTSGGTAGHAGGTSGGTAGHAGGTSGGTAGTSGGTAGTSGGTAGTNSGTAGTSGGTAGAGGATAGAGGHTNTDGGTAYASFAYNFDTDKEGFAINTGAGAGNLAAIEGGAHPSLTWDGGVGKPNVGSLKVDATFTTYKQYVLTTIDLNPLIDATGKTAHAWVMVDSVDGGPAFGGGAQLETNSTTSYHGANGAYTTLTPGVWKELTLDLSTTAQPSPFDASQLIQIAVQFGTGSGPEGGTFGAPVHAIFHIDSITDGTGNAAPPLLSHTFDKNTEGYSLSTSIVTPDGGTVPALTWDGTVGSPTNGSLKIVAEFTGYNQKIDTSVNIAPLANLTGKVIHAKVRIDSGTLPSSYVQVHASSGTSYVYANSTGTALGTAGTFMDFSLDLAAAHTANASFDPTQIIQVGVQIGAGGGPEGGTFPTPVPLTFHIDSIVAQ
jgi:hypothetical protein